MVESQSRGTRAPPPAAVLPPIPRVPSPLGRRVLLFVFLVLIEYWLSPLFFGVQNYAGLWSGIGWLLFAVAVASLIGFVVLPLRPHLRRALSSRRTRALFVAAWGGGAALGLFATNTLQLIGPVSSGGGPVQLAWQTVYTPFGPWTSAWFTVDPIGLVGVFNLEVLTVLGLLSFLWASALVLGPLRVREACAVTPAVDSRRRGRLASAAAWGPFGLISSCPSCAPAYVAWLATVAPGPAMSGYAAIPLVPWISLAGLLFLASLGVTVLVLSRATRPADPMDAPRAEALP